MTQPLWIACLLAYVTCVGSFAWAMSGPFFRRVDRVGWGFRSIQIGGTIAFVWNLWALHRHDRIEPFSGMAALVLYTASLLCFWWSVAAHSTSAKARPALAASYIAATGSRQSLRSKIRRISAAAASSI
jgi:hypothetical protein